MSLKTLYQALLVPAYNHAGDPVSEQMQTRIFDHCLARKDWETMTALAKYYGLHPNVDARIREQDQIDVLHAWVTRPGRTSEELVARILNDKRVNVLLPLAGIRDLDATVYQTIAKVKSPTLGEALAGNPSVPDEIRVSKIREFVQRVPRGAYQRHETHLHKLCGGGESTESSTSPVVRKLYEAAAQTTMLTPWIIACLQRPYVRPSDVDRWIADLPNIFDSGDGQWYSRNAELLQMLASRVSSAEQREKLLTTAKDYAANHGKQNWRVSQLQSTISALEATDDGFEQLINELTQETDPERCTELVAALRSQAKPADLGRIASVVAWHNHVPLPTAIEFIPAMSSHGRSNDFEAFVKRLEREKAFGYLSGIVEGYKSYGNPYVPAPVRWLENPEVFMRWYADQRANAGITLPDWFSESRVITENLPYAMKALSWSRLCEIIPHMPGLSTLVEGRVLEVLGTDPAHWEAFTTLGQDFDGSLEDLLGAAASL